VLNFPPTVRIFVAIEPADLRGSFDALAGRVRRQGGDPLDGHLYVFLNARRTLMKILWFDRNGWAVYAKRLEQGSFEIPAPEGDARRVVVDGATLAMILEGIDLRAPRRLRYQHPRPDA
jgi:transposase